MLLKELAIRDRPREKLVDIGAENLSESELLAIIIGSGTPDFNALLVSQRIFHSCSNDFKKLNALSLEDFQKFKGIGTVKAVRIKAALEFGKRQMLKEEDDLISVVCSKDAYALIRKKLEHLVQEEFWIILLNRASKVLHQIRISIGGIAGTVVDQKVIFMHAVNYLASSIILVHNHPSGSLKPSKEDIMVTQKISSSAKLLDIAVVDHLIISNKGYFSFADNGMKDVF